MLVSSSSVTATTVSVEATPASLRISGSSTSPCKTIVPLSMLATDAARSAFASMILMLIPVCPASISWASSNAMLPPPQISSRRASGSS